MNDSCAVPAAHDTYDSNQTSTTTRRARPRLQASDSSVRPSADKQLGRMAGLYDLQGTIGRGHFAVVRRARHVFSGEQVAVKAIDKARLDATARDNLFQEVRCMKLVQHPNIVRLYEVIDTHSKLYLILELADGGDLYDYLTRHSGAGGGGGGLCETLCRRYFGQIVCALSYCHQLRVVHRDLKPENVVFFERRRLVKLTDFGFSNRFLPGQHLHTSCGSLAYSAPEILLGDSYDPPSVDIWSLGAVLYMLVCGRPPFQEANDSETLSMIMDCKYHVPATVSSSCRSLIGRMLQREPRCRATLHDIERDEWLTASAEKGHTDRQVDRCHRVLVGSERLSEANRQLIVRKIVAGGLCSHDRLIQSLENNEYNYMTATYYLLAERRLQQLQRQQSAAASVSTAAGSVNAAAGSVNAAAGSVSTAAGSVDTLSSEMTTGMFINDNQLECEQAKPVPSMRSSPPQHNTCQSVCTDGEGNGGSPHADAAVRPPALMRQLHAVRSSPHLLEIREEDELEDEEEIERAEGFNCVAPVVCATSSSDDDSGDEKMDDGGRRRRRRRRLLTPTSLTMSSGGAGGGAWWRRGDSHDDSSDSAADTASAGGHHRRRTNTSRSTDSGSGGGGGRAGGDCGGAEGGGKRAASGGATTPRRHSVCGVGSELLAVQHGDQHQLMTISEQVSGRRVAPHICAECSVDRQQFVAAFG